MQTEPQEVIRTVANRDGEMAQGEEDLLFRQAIQIQVPHPQSGPQQ